MKTLADLQVELDAAMTFHAECEVEESVARKNMTEATNRLNIAQKEFDARVEEMRSKAPWNTNWHSKRNPGQPVTG